MTKLQEMIALLSWSVSKSNLPCLKERGGNGKAVIICDSKGSKKTALVIRKNPEPNTEQAVIPVQKSDIAIVVIKDDMSIFQVTEVLYKDGFPTGVSIEQIATGVLIGANNPIVSFDTDVVQRIHAEDLGKAILAATEKSREQECITAKWVNYKVQGVNYDTTAADRKDRKVESGVFTLGTVHDQPKRRKDPPVGRSSGYRQDNNDKRAYQKPKP